MVFDFLNWREAMVTNDEEHYIKIVKALETAGIQYRVKAQNAAHGNRRGGRINALGQNQRYACIYQVYVKKPDVEQAKFVCRNVR